MNKKYSPKTITVAFRMNKDLAKKAKHWANKYDQPEAALYRLLISEGLNCIEKRQEIIPFKISKNAKFSP